eukprot:gene9797-6874_t
MGTGASDYLSNPTENSPSTTRTGELTKERSGRGEKKKVGRQRAVSSKAGVVEGSGAVKTWLVLHQPCQASRRNTYCLSAFSGLVWDCSEARPRVDEGNLFPPDYKGNEKYNTRADGEWLLSAREELAHLKHTAWDMAQLRSMLTNLTAPASLPIWRQVLFKPIPAPASATPPSSKDSRFGLEGFSRARYHLVEASVGKNAAAGATHQCRPQPTV